MGQPGEEERAVLVGNASSMVKACMHQIAQMALMQRQSQVTFWSDRLRNLLYEILRVAPKVSFITADGFFISVERDNDHELWMMAEHNFTNQLIDGLHQSMKYDNFIDWYKQNTQLDVMALSGGV